MMQISLSKDIAEAHSYLEEVQRVMTQNRHLFSDEAIEANAIAILALELQLPRKTIEDGYQREGLVCPNCGEPFDHWQDGHCFICGQLLTIDEK